MKRGDDAARVGRVKTHRDRIDVDVRDVPVVARRDVAAKKITANAAPLRRLCFTTTRRIRRAASRARFRRSAPIACALVVMRRTPRRAARFQKFRERHEHVEIARTERVSEFPSDVRAPLPRCDGDPRRNAAHPSDSGRLAEDDDGTTLSGLDARALHRARAIAGAGSV